MVAKEHAGGADGRQLESLDTEEVYGFLVQLEAEARQDAAAEDAEVEDADAIIASSGHVDGPEAMEKESTPVAADKAIAHTLAEVAEMQPEQVAQLMCLVLRRLCSKEAANAIAAEARLLAWAREWLVLPAETRVAYAKALLEGLLPMPTPVQARHFSFLVALRYGTWEPPKDPELHKRLRRGVRAGRAGMLVLATLPASELDKLGEVAAEVLGEQYSPLAAARVVMRLPPARRRHLQKLLVYEEVMAEDAAARLFRAMEGALSVLGVERLESTLNALEAVVGLGGSALSAGRYGLGMIRAVGSDTLGLVCEAGCGVADVLSDAAMASAGAAFDMLFSGTPKGKPMLEETSTGPADELVPTPCQDADLKSLAPVSPTANPTYSAQFI